MAPEHQMFSATFNYQEYLLSCIGGNLTQNLFAEFQVSRMHIDMHWWDFKTKSFWRFSAIKRILIHVHWWDLNTKSSSRFSAIINTYWNALVGPEHQIFSSYFSYQDYFFACFGGTWTPKLFGEFQLSRKLVVMHWWDLNTTFFDDFRLSRILMR